MRRAQGTTSRNASSSAGALAVLVDQRRRRGESATALIEAFALTPP
jgi:hypothetical protein